MKTNLVLLCFAFFAFSFQIKNTSTDITRITVSNAAPRVGDEVELVFDIDFFNDEIREQLPNGIELKDNTIGAETEKLTKLITFKKSGQYTVGPFNFEFNGKKIVTSTIELNVAEKLPFKEGVWIRYVESKTQKYFIVEQLLASKIDKKKKSDGFSYTIGSNANEKDLVEIIRKPTEGLELMMQRSVTKPKGKNGNIFDSSMTYSFKKYVITTTDSFKGSFKLKEKHLKNIPKKTKINIDVDKINK